MDELLQETDDSSTDAFTCVIWERSLNNGFGNWTVEGCEMVEGASTNVVECECDRLGVYSLLVVSG